MTEISMSFHDLARWVVSELPRNPERTVALRKQPDDADRSSVNDCMSVVMA